MDARWRANIEREKQMLVRRVELSARVRDAQRPRHPDHVKLRAPADFRHSVTGRRELQPPPDLVAAGVYFRRARIRAGKSQERLALETGVSQSMISRFERGLAPGMRVEKLATLATAIDRLFPLGTCPHDHDCAWQPYKTPEYHQSAVEALVESILGSGPEHEERDGTPEERESERPDRNDFFDITLSQIRSPDDD
jgi:transcriptional regulator with XRE-family HTH domain